MKIDEVADHIGEHWRVKWGAYPRGSGNRVNRVRLDAVVTKQAGHGYSLQKRRVVAVTYCDEQTGEAVDVTGGSDLFVRAQDLCEPWEPYAERRTAYAKQCAEARDAAEYLARALSFHGITKRASEYHGGVDLALLDAREARIVADALQAWSSK